MPCPSGWRGSDDASVHSRCACSYAEDSVPEDDVWRATVQAERGARISRSREGSGGGLCLRRACWHPGSIRLHIRLVPRSIAVQHSSMRLCLCTAPLWQMYIVHNLQAFCRAPRCLLQPSRGQFRSSGISRARSSRFADTWPYTTPSTSGSFAAAAAAAACLSDIAQQLWSCSGR